MANLPILPEERHRLIRQRLEAQGRVLAVDLARDLSISEDTIRRDLRELAALGHCQRVYGGALRLSPASGDLQTRQRQNPEGKALAARRAVGLVQPGHVLFLDAGSTNRAIADALPDHADLTVITNAPDIALAVAARPGFTVIQVGGVLNPSIGGTLGARAVREVADYAADLCFVGACAVSAEVGIRCFTLEDAEFKRAVIAASRAVAVAVTAEKLGTAASFHVADLAAIDHLVVGGDVPNAALAPLLDAGLTILQAAA
jgi:DeoR/GlpR family transcriptional regulator of sugar metabolism